MPSDIEIAQKANMQRISKLAAEKLGIAEDHLEPYGHYKAKVSLEYVDSLKDKPDGKLILVTAISPTPAGEGKTTTTVGLGDALNHIGKKAMICLREPSLGPVFGVKGGAAGGGYAQVVPMEDINLHFTGDFYAIALANNLLAALIDNHIHHGNELGIDVRRIAWKRVVDMNDRALRDIVVSLGGTGNGYPRQDGFDIVVASEVMAIFCLSTSLEDLKNRLGNIVVGYTRDQKPVYARDLNAHGAMTVLLNDALAPNLVQTLENNPAFIHGGPFANIAHGCNSVIATKTALKLADYVVTEAGFGADLGAEKFLDIKCRKSGLRPVGRGDRGDGARDEIPRRRRPEDDHAGKPRRAGQGPGQPGAPRRQRAAGLRHPLRGVDQPLHQRHRGRGRPAQGAHGQARRQGGAGDALGRRRQGRGRTGEASWSSCATKKSNLTFVYEEQDSLWDKINKIAKKVYRASEVTADAKVRNQIKKLQEDGYGHYPVCVAKTQSSFSTDAQLRGAPENHVINVREVRLAAGAEFVVMVCGDIMTMPGLPKVPSADKIDLVDGKVVGLF